MLDENDSMDTTEDRSRQLDAASDDFSSTLAPDSDQDRDGSDSEGTLRGDDASETEPESDYGAANEASDAEELSDQEMLSKLAIRDNVRLT
jgi:hypothetical protein